MAPKKATEDDHSPPPPKQPIQKSDINHKSKEYYAHSLLARRVLFVKGPDGGKEALLEQEYVF
ncbi:unnamed protein product [Rhodiola kirilowii]